VRRERVAEVRRWLDNYQKLREHLRAQPRSAASGTVRIEAAEEAA
jgi:hypothetical protein